MTTRLRHDTIILFALAFLQLLGYVGLWALLHLPNVIPAVNNGWFVADSAYSDAIVHLPLFIWLQRRDYVAGLLLLLGFALLSLLYACSIVLVRRWSISVSTGVLIGCTACIAVPLLFLPHLFSSDVYSYAMFGRIPVLYGGNPFIDPPAHFASDPLLTNIYWKTTASVYGPVWIIVSLPVTLVAQALGGGLGVYVLLYKLVSFAVFLASVVVIKQLLLRVTPARATWGAMMYAWHPLVLVEFVGSGHNDSLMVLLILLALLLAHRQRPLLTVAVLVLAGLVKFVALALVPVYLLYTLRTSGERAVFRITKQIIVGLSIILIMYAPFWAGPSTLAILRTAPPLTLLHDSPADWIAAQLTNATCAVAGTSIGADRSQSPRGAVAGCREAVMTDVRLVSLGMFVLVCVALLLWPVRNLSQLLERSAQLFLAYILLAAVHFEPWYVTWLLALTPLLRRPPILFVLWGCVILLLYSSLPLPGRLILAYAPFILHTLRVAARRAGRVLAKHVHPGMT